jgi:beta-N-acetylglucosaminidase
MLRKTQNRRTQILVAATLFMLAALVMSFFAAQKTAYAYTPIGGTVNDGPVNVRKEPVTGTRVTRLSFGAQVTVIDETTGSDGYKWYQIQYTASDGTTGSGYIRSDFVTLSQQSTVTDTDNEYIASLKAAGFPDSYCDALAALHQKYPSWQFVAVQTGLDWNTVVANESVAGRNLVQSSVNDSRKSTDAAAYNWETNTWYGFDGASWVSASSDYIAYCMDPRNFLNETYIFQFETLDYADYQNTAGVSNILAGTFMSGNYTDTDGTVRSYADTFVEVGSSLGVSPYHLASRCKQEQGTKGTSPLISGTYSGYEGYYNYFNVRAYTTALASATVNGLSYAQSVGWNSIYKSILGGSSVIGNNYVKKGQNTIYFEKFNVVYQNSLYSHQYMTNVMAAISEGSSMGKAYTDKTQSFVFRIPVYQNMPDSAVTFSDKGNPNNYLSSLTVEGYNLTPVFTGQNSSYTLVVGCEVASVNVTATAVAGTSAISGTGNYALNYGDNTINVTCTSQSGDARTYTVTVARQQPVVSGNTIDFGNGVSVTSAYPIGTYMTGIEPMTEASVLLSNISAAGCSVKVLRADGTENTGTVGTGNRIVIYDANGAVIGQYEAVVYGDINGDGKISNVDVVLLQKQILGIEQQAGCYLEAANTSRDGGVSNKDLVILQKHILGIENISQQ